MYAGHLAAGLALKAKEPRAPTWALVLGAGWLDVVHGVLVLVGVEHVAPDPSKFLGWNLEYMPWTHSLAAAIAWSLAAGLAFARRGRAVAIAIGLAVFSHFALDFPMHEHDLALAPGSSVKLGLGLWGWSANGAWAIEAAFVAACAAYYAVRARRVGTFGGRWPVVIAVLALLHIGFLPALSAMRMAGVHLAG
jgi:hypothetical protein